MTTWTSRYHLVIPAANKDDANNTFPVLDPDTGGWAITDGGAAV